MKKEAPENEASYFSHGLREAVFPFALGVVSLTRAGNREAGASKTWAGEARKSQPWCICEKEVAAVVEEVEVSPDWLVATWGVVLVSDGSC